MSPPTSLDQRYRLFGGTGDPDPGDLALPFARRSKSAGPAGGNGARGHRAVHRWRGEPQGSLGGAPLIESAATQFDICLAALSRRRSLPPLTGGR